MKILIIPHTGERKLKTRWLEIATSISSKCKVYFLSWKEPRKNSIVYKIFTYLKNLFTKKIKKSENINLVYLPILHRPWKLAKYFNWLMIKNFIKKEKIDIVINSHSFLFSIFPDGFKYVYDFPDLPCDFNKSTNWDRYIYKFTHDEVKKADLITVCSNELKEIIKINYEKEPVVIPNGVNLDKFKNKNDERIRKIKKELNLENKYVIGYIGNILHYVDIEFLINVFLQVKKEMDDLALLIIGPSNRKIKRKNNDMHILNEIPKEEIHNFFHILDIGTLPNKVKPINQYASYMKIFEYTAAGKFIISTPLLSVINLKFPNIFFAEFDINKWATLIRKIRKSRIENYEFVHEYDISKISEKLLSLLT